MNPVLVALVFVVALLSMQSPFPVPAPTPRRQGPSSGWNWPVTEYERGPSGPQKRRSPRQTNRYRAQPSMRRLMRDLRRPVARADAERILLTRIADGDLRAWVSEQVMKDRVNRLSIYVREGIPEEAVVTAWRAELDAERAAKAEAADEAWEQAHVLRTLTALARNDVDLGVRW